MTVLLDSARGPRRAHAGVFVGAAGVVVGVLCYLLGRALKAVLGAPPATVHFFSALGLTFLVAGVVTIAAELSRPHVQKVASGWFVEKHRRRGEFIAGAAVTIVACVVMYFVGKATSQAWAAVLAMVAWVPCALWAMWARRRRELALGLGYIQPPPPGWLPPAPDHTTIGASTSHLAQDTTPIPSAPQPGVEDGGVLPMKPARPLREVLAAMESLIGLTDFKTRIRRDLAYQEAERIKREKDPDYEGGRRKLHCIYAGPPGTGKTMVAELHAEAYTALGISNGRFAKTSSSKLLGAGYIGHVRRTLRELIEKTTGGVLFIDEFGALLNARGQGDMGQEIVEELLDQLENNPDCPLIIVADYGDRIDEALSRNDGLASRFRNRFTFISYTPEELLRIAELHIKNDRHRLSPDARERLADALAELYHRYSATRAWSSARVAVTLYGKAKEAQSEALPERLEQDRGCDVMRIEAADIDDGLGAYLDGKPFPAQKPQGPFASIGS